MTTTFAVDDVEPATVPAPTIALRDLISDHVWLGGDPEMRVLERRRAHPLIGAVHHAFADHRPLVLSPDAVWLTIAQGVAQHVRLNADALRPRLVRHTGKRTLEIMRSTWPCGPDDWAAAITEFRTMIGDEIGEGRARLLTCDFSTTTDAERVASEIVLLDAMSPYFDFKMLCVCGIPQITLTGTPADWRAIRARIDVIAELDLAQWCASLAPIADRLVAASEGRPDIDFFRAIYKPRAAYGEERATGWITRLYPYLSRRGDYAWPNPMLKLAFDQLPPSSLARVVVRVSGGKVERQVVIEGGLLAIELDADGRLVPRAGYVVREVVDDVAVMIDRLLARGATPRSRSDSTELIHPVRVWWQDDARLHAIFDAIDSVSLGPWRVLPARERTWILVGDSRRPAFYAQRIIDLDDGGVLAVCGDPCIVIRLDDARLVTPAPLPSDGELPVGSLRAEQPITEIPVVARSLIDLLSRALSDDYTLDPLALLLELEPRLVDSASHATSLVDRLDRAHAIVRGPGLFDLIAALEMRVGDATWRLFVEPLAWKYALKGVVVGGSHVYPMIDLGDGRALARVGENEIVVIELAAIATSRPPGARRTRILSSQPADQVPVVGRCLVDVLTFALDHGKLPDASRMLIKPTSEISQGRT